MSQQELANFSGVSRNRLSFAELGTVELTPDELHRIFLAVAQEPIRRAAKIRQVLASYGIDLGRIGSNNGSHTTPDSAFATAAKGLSRSCEMYGSKLVEHLKKLMPVPAAEAVAGLAAEAVENE